MQNYRRKSLGTKLLSKSNSFLVGSFGELQSKIQSVEKLQIIQNIEILRAANGLLVNIRVTCHFVLRHFNRCNFNRSHFQPFTLSTACLFERLQIQPPQIRPI